MAISILSHWDSKASNASRTAAGASCLTWCESEQPRTMRRPPTVSTRRFRTRPPVRLAISHSRRPVCSAKVKRSLGCASTQLVGSYPVGLDGRVSRYTLLWALGDRHRDPRERHPYHGQNTSHRLRPFMLGKRKKPTWRNTRRYSTTSAYSLTSPSAGPGRSLSSHPTNSLESRGQCVAPSPTPLLYAAAGQRQ